MNKWTQWIRFIDKVGHHDAVIIVENIINHSAIDMICMDRSMVPRAYNVWHWNDTSLKQKYEIKISRLLVLNLSAWYFVIFKKCFFIEIWKTTESNSSLAMFLRWINNWEVSSFAEIPFYPLVSTHSKDLPIWENCTVLFI